MKRKAKKVEKTAEKPDSADVQPLNANPKVQAAERLYLQRKAQIDKTDKAKEDYEFERQGEECTFQPKKYTSGVKASTKVSVVQS